MKPLLYFAHCPQTEAIDALNWTDGLTDTDREIIACCIIDSLNNARLSSIDSEVCVKVDASNFSRAVYAFHRQSASSTITRYRVLSAIIIKIAKAADGMPIEYCRGAIDYFNQF